MRRYGIWFALALVMALLLAANAFAQQGVGKGKGLGGWDAKNPYIKLYDVNTVETLKGEVIAFETFVPRKGMATGHHLVLKTDNETISVHLGPTWYMNRQNFEIKVGDNIEVRGSRISYQGKPAIVAAEVKKDNSVLQLRDENGNPAWIAAGQVKPAVKKKPSIKQQTPETGSK